MVECDMLEVQSIYYVRAKDGQKRGEYDEAGMDMWTFSIRRERLLTPDS